MRLTLNIWRQKSPTDQGKMVPYSLDNVSEHMSFLEMLDVLNEQLIAKGEEPVAFAGEGGSIPFLASLGQRFPSVQFVATGVLGPHSNAHGIDEMLDLDCAVAVTNAMSHVIAAHAQRKDA